MNSKPLKDKTKATAKNKIQRIEKELKKHPKVANNGKMMERLKFWKSKAL